MKLGMDELLALFKTGKETDSEDEKGVAPGVGKGRRIAQ